MSINLEHQIRLDNKCEVINKKETITIECSNPACKKTLLIVYHIPYQENNVKYKLRVNCPFCLRRSYDFEVKGDFKYVPCKDILLTNIKEVESENLVIWETQKAK